MGLLEQTKLTISASMVTVFFFGTALADQITVFAASSLKEALDDIALGFQETTGHVVTVSYAGSSALARQIEYSAPADVFISANADWMDSLGHRGLIVPETRFDLLRNRLVLIGPAHDKRTVALSPDLDIQGVLRGGRLAMALTKAVPAGIYGKSALTSLGLWEDVASYVAETDNVRAALALVALGAAPVGIVYATDARADARVRTLAVFPEHSHPVIVYPAAATRQSPSATTLTFLDYLHSPDAHAVFEGYGFLTEAE